jgi:Spy/CpxP family protein refolding chaperone
MMMRSSKSLALAFVLGALLVGGVVGFTADRVLGLEEQTARFFTRAELRQRFAERLDLSPPQRAKVDSILDRKRAAMDSLLAPVRPAMKAVSDSTARAIDGVLDARQRAKFAKMRAENEKREAGGGERMRHE